MEEYSKIFKIETFLIIIFYLLKTTIKTIVQLVVKINREGLDSLTMFRLSKSYVLLIDIYLIVVFSEFILSRTL